MKKMIFKGWKKILIFTLMTAIMGSFLTGCGRVPVVKGKGEVSDNEILNGEKDVKEEDAADSTAKGRYVEQEIELPMSPSRPVGIVKLSDGTLVIPDKEGPRLISKDGGETWETDQQGWFQEILNDYYIIDMAVLPNGDTVIAGSEHGGDWDTAEKILVLVKEDGTKVSFDMPPSLNNGYINHIFASDSGRAFAVGLGSDMIYELNPEDGSMKEYLKTESIMALAAFSGHTMILCDTRANMWMYDMDTESYIEDPVWKDFMEEQYAMNSFSGGDNAYEFYVFPGEENAFYLAGKKGLHRHVAGGSAIEQVIDGTLSSFSSPLLALQGMVMIEGEQFLTLFSDYYKSKLVRYVYDPDIPTVPGQRIKAYSLKENDTLRQAISVLQSADSDVYVDYQIGMQEGSSTTRDDALKKLNTEIMSGEGPDILILDGLPIDSYVEKGILKDLGPLLSEMTGSDALFENITDAFIKDGKLYYIPAQVSLAAVAGHEKDVAGIKDLASFADAVEMLRRENPEKDILGLYSDRMVLKMCALSGEVMWKKEDGTIDEALLKEFYTQAKRIYDAQMDGLPQKYIDKFNELDARYWTDFGYRYDESDYGLSMIKNTMEFCAGKEPMLMVGKLDNDYDYHNIISVKRTDGNDDVILQSLGEKGNCVFVPASMIGIFASTEKEETAQSLVEIMLGTQVQAMMNYGLPVNKEAFEKKMEDNAEQNKVEGQSYAGMYTSDENGVGMGFDIYWPDAKEKDEFLSLMLGLKSAYINDLILEEAVIEEGEALLQGRRNVDETVLAVMEKVSLHMAE